MQQPPALPCLLPVVSVFSIDLRQDGSQVGKFLDGVMEQSLGRFRRHPDPFRQGPDDFSPDFPVADPEPGTEHHPVFPWIPFMGHGRRHLAFTDGTHQGFTGFGTYQSFIESEIPGTFEAQLEEFRPHPGVLHNVVIHPQVF